MSWAELSLCHTVIDYLQYDVSCCSDKVLSFVHDLWSITAFNLRLMAEEGPVSQQWDKVNLGQPSLLGEYRWPQEDNVKINVWITTIDCFSSTGGNDQPRYVFALLNTNTWFEWWLKHCSVFWQWFSRLHYRPYVCITNMLASGYVLPRQQLEKSKRWSSNAALAAQLDWEVMKGVVWDKKMEC